MVDRVSFYRVSFYRGYGGRSRRLGRRVDCVCGVHHATHCTEASQDCKASLSLDKLDLSTRSCSAPACQVSSSFAGAPAPTLRQFRPARPRSAHLPSTLPSHDREALACRAIRPSAVARPSLARQSGLPRLRGLPLPGNPAFRGRTAAHCPAIQPRAGARVSLAGQSSLSRSHRGPLPGNPAPRGREGLGCRAIQPFAVAKRPIPREMRLSRSRKTPFAWTAPAPRQWARRGGPKLRSDRLSARKPTKRSFIKRAWLRSSPRRGANVQSRSC